MIVQLPLKEIRDGSFFRNLGSLKTEDLTAHLRWASLLTTDRLWDWLKQDKGAECALAAGRCEVAWQAAFAVLLERHLLNLGTRFDPNPLFEFWEWVTTAAKCNGIVAGIWRQNEKDIRGSCGEGTLSLEHIVAQEKTFAEVLLRAEDAMSKAPGKLEWATKTVRRLAARRSGGGVGDLPCSSFARVVFAWEDGVPAELRPAILIDLELGKQGAGEPYIDSGEVFGSTFHQAVRHVAEKLIGRRRFHQLRFQPPSGVELAPGALTGESGGLAILLAQILANRHTGRWPKHWFALPPWVVVTATLDSDSEGRPCGVGAIEAKIRLLREMGVRLVVVANETAQLTMVTNVLRRFEGRDGMATMWADRSPRRTAERLIDEGCAWQTDIEKAPIISRRAALLAVGGLALTAVGSGIIGACCFSDSRTVEVPQPRPQTEAMKQGLELHPPLKKKAEEVREYAAQSGIDSYFRDVLKATEIRACPVWGVSAAGMGASPFGQGPLLAATTAKTDATVYLIEDKVSFRQAPVETSFRGLKILLDSKFFDSSDWAEVSSLEELARKPIEPAYFTRVLRLQKENDAPHAIAAEFNTGGLCVVPVMNPSRGDKVYYCLKPMDESKAAGKLTRTAYLVIDISQMGNDGQPFDLVVNAIWFNGAQDQRLRFYEDGPKKGQRVDHDWWGTRIWPGTACADLAVRLPKHRAFGSVRRFLRKEDETRKLIPFKEVPEGDPGDLEPTYKESPLYVWTFPCKRDEELGFRWIYSIQWEWKER
jgi:hypothetical protein